MVAHIDTHSRLDPMRKYHHLEIDVASRKLFMHWTRLQCVEDADDMTRRATARVPVGVACLPGMSVVRWR